MTQEESNENNQEKNTKEEAIEEDGDDKLEKLSPH